MREIDEPLHKGGTELEKIIHEFNVILETPARVMKGKKQMNPNWKCLPEWAYWKAPTTKDHKFSAYNHKWTAGVLYPERDACWVFILSCLMSDQARKDVINADRTALIMRGLFGTSYVVDDELVEGTKVAHQSLHTV